MAAFGTAVRDVIAYLKTTEPIGRKNCSVIAAEIALVRGNCVLLDGVFFEYGNTPSSPPEAARWFSEKSLPLCANEGIGRDRLDLNFARRLEGPEDVEFFLDAGEILIAGGEGGMKKTRN